MWCIKILWTLNKNGWHQALRSRHCSLAGRQKFRAGTVSMLAACVHDVLCAMSDNVQLSVAPHRRSHCQAQAEEDGEKSTACPRGGIFFGHREAANRFRAEGASHEDHETEKSKTDKTKTDKVKESGKQGREEAKSTAKSPHKSPDEEENQWIATNLITVTRSLDANPVNRATGHPSPVPC
jgi:hypothetical protein